MIKQIISEHKYIKKNQPLKAGFKRVEAIVENNGRLSTQHVEMKI